MQASIIVPVRNESAHIRQTLTDLLHQDFPASEYEILVVDGMSEDGTPEIVREMAREDARIRLFANPRRLSSAARNIGVRNARGEYLLIVDGHCRLRDDRLLRSLVDAFAESGADTLGRPQPLRADSPSDFQHAVRAARESWMGHNPDSAIYSDQARFVPPDNVAIAYRREVFEQVGLFDESFDACEDVEFNTRVRQAGLTCYFTPTLSVDYEPRGTWRALFHQMARYGRGRARLAWKHPASITLASVIPPLWPVWLILVSVAAVLWLPAAWLLALSTSLYGLAIFGESGRLWQRDRSLPYRRLPAVFAAIHFGYAWGYLRQFAHTSGSIPVISFARLVRLRTPRV